MEVMMTAPQQWTKMSEVTVKQLQIILKSALNKIDSLNVTEKLKIEFYDEENIIKFRQNCKNPKLRNIYFRLIHNDFFTHVKMKKYNMTQSDECPRCGEPEDLKHLLWGCTHARHIWSIYNTIMESVKHKKTENYNEVFIPGEDHATCVIKVKIIQVLIQIDRPKHWNYEKIKKLIDQTMSIELYNASRNCSLLAKYNARWKSFKTIFNEHSQ
jgi:hypothetical protein